MSKGYVRFKATGIFPINPNVLSDEDFMVAEVLHHYQQILRIMIFFLYHYYSKTNKHE